MNGTSRMVSILDAEVSRHLCFVFTVSENLTRRGTTMLRPGDRFRFTVWAINRSDIALAWLRGRITPTASAGFVPVPFSIARLAPGERQQIVTIEARATSKPGIRFVRLDTIGSVSITTSPDLSAVRLHKTKQLTYIQPVQDSADSVAS